jgi:hypothetical protein
LLQPQILERPNEECKNYALHFLKFRLLHI